MQLLQDYVIQNSKKSKKTTYSNAYKIFTLAGLLIVLYCRLSNIRISACVYPQAYFLRQAKNKIRTGYIGAASGGAQGARPPPPNQNTTNDKKL